LSRKTANAGQIFGAVKKNQTTLSMEIIRPFECLLWIVTLSSLSSTVQCLSNHHPTKDIFSIDAFSYLTDIESMIGGEKETVAQPNLRPIIGVLAQVTCHTIRLN
jgi:hypothetical protein